MDGIDKIFIINLDYRVDRWKKCEEQLKEYNISNYERVSAVKEEIKDIKENYSGFLSKDEKYIIGANGCKKSHLKILKKAKAENINNILILEDDFLLCKNFIDKYNSTIEQIKLNNIEFDILYLGFSIIEDGISKTIINDTEIKNVKKIKNAYTTHAYILNIKTYDTFIKEIELSDCEIDASYNYIQHKYKAIGILPSLISQNFSYSDIQHKNVNYTSIHLDE